MTNFWPRGRYAPERLMDRIRVPFLVTHGARIARLPSTMRTKATTS